MDLKEFVKESIVQIAQGIDEANSALSDSTAMVNPTNIAANSGSAQAYARTKSPDDQQSSRKIVEKVQFDVAVVATTAEEGTVGGKLSIAAIGIGAEGKKESTNQSESRIKFSIPVVYPGFNNRC